MAAEAAEVVVELPSGEEQMGVHSAVAAGVVRAAQSLLI